MCWLFTFSSAFTTEMKGKVPNQRTLKNANCIYTMTVHVQNKKLPDELLKKDNISSVVVCWVVVSPELWTR